MLSVEVRRFFQIAVQRFEDAQFLYAHDRGTGAMYLAGYAVECSLKALLLAHIPRSKQETWVKLFRGKLGHDFEWLKNELRRKGVQFPTDINRLLRKVNSWSTDLRYFAGRVKLITVKDFLESVSQFLHWIERRM